MTWEMLNQMDQNGVYHIHRQTPMESLVSSDGLTFFPFVVWSAH